MENKQFSFVDWASIPEHIRRQMEKDQAEGRNTGYLCEDTVEASQWAKDLSGKRMLELIRDIRTRFETLFKEEAKTEITRCELALWTDSAIQQRADIEQASDDESKVKAFDERIHEQAIEHAKQTTKTEVFFDRIRERMKQENKDFKEFSKPNAFYDSWLRLTYPSLSNAQYALIEKAAKDLIEVDQVRAEQGDAAAERLIDEKERAVEIANKNGEIVHNYSLDGPYIPSVYHAEDGTMLEFKNVFAAAEKAKTMKGPQDL